MTTPSDPTAALRRDECPCCGALCEVITSDEGTSYMRPLTAEPEAARPLDAAWAEAEAALPEGWRILAVSWPTEHDDEWAASAGGEGKITYGKGQTPAAALHALAARLAKGGAGS
jgi:hypothetical protein